MGFKRRLSRAQGDRYIQVEQNGFLGGMNLDKPSSEIDATELSNLENVIAYRTHLEARPGTIEYDDLSAVGSGTYYGLYFHSGGEFLVLHRGTGVHVSADYGVTWSTATGSETVITAASSKIDSLGDDVVIFQETGIYIVELTNSYYLRKLNSANPTSNLDISSTEAAGSYTYRYLYTYARYVDNVLIAESGTINNGSEKTVNYTEISTTSALTSNSQVSINSFATPSDTQWTHIRIYRTLNINSTTIDDDTNPDAYFLCATMTIAQANGTSPYGIGSIIIGSSYTIGGTIINPAGADSVISKNEIAKTIDFVPLPNGVVGATDQAFIFVSPQDAKTIYYSSTGVRVRVGYYNEGYQYQQTDDSIKAIIVSPDNAVICCNSSTYRFPISSFEDAGEALLGQTIPILPNPTLMDSNIGIVDIGSIAKMDLSRFIAHCSDNTIRIWDGDRWGGDLARFRVHSEIVKIATGSVGIYDPQGFYLLFYRVATASTVTTKTLRLGLAEDVGMGWSYYNGAGWSQPPLNTGVISIIDSNHGVQKILVLDNSDNKIYWVETFDGPTGTSLSRQTQDKAATDIVCVVEWKEAKGSTEAFFISHKQTNIYFRPIARQSSLISGFEGVLKAYINDSSTATSEYNFLDPDGDIHFSEQVTGHRIRQVLTTNKGGFKIASIRSIYQVQDRPVVNNTDQKVFSYQSELSQNIVFWSSRISMLKDLYDNSSAVLTGSDIDAEASSPDGNSYALELNTGAYGTTSYLWTKSSTITLSGDYTLFFWIKVQSAGANASPAISFYTTGAGDATALRFDFASNVYVSFKTTIYEASTVASMADGNWHSVIYRRSSGTTSLYFDYTNGDSATDSFADGVSHAFSKIVFGPSNQGLSLFDVRLYSSALSLDALNYLITNTSSYSGKSVLPLA